MEKPEKEKSTSCGFALWQSHKNYARQKLSIWNNVAVWKYTKWEREWEREREREMESVCVCVPDGASGKSVHMTHAAAGQKKKRRKLCAFCLHLCSYFWSAVAINKTKQNNRKRANAQKVIKVYQVYRNIYIYIYSRYTYRHVHIHCLMSCADRNAIEIVIEIDR